MELINMKNKPCPFCGSSDIQYQTSTEDREGFPTNIMCGDCGCAGPWVYIKESELEKDMRWRKVNDEWVQGLPVRALELWNARVENAIVLMDKQYNGEDTYEIERDVVGLVRSSFDVIPGDEDGVQPGKFRLLVTWQAK